ncbi:MAG: hypothetical protein HS100_04230 [Anaerolineales bacterium]|nr:hypothetical protein [Anaerolineales bacterium]
MATAVKNQMRNVDIVELAAQRAREHVAFHQPTHDGREVELYKLRGRIGEELSQESINGANLNDLTGKSNFANYDLVSKDCISSVKVKGLTEQGEPRFADYNKYFRDVVNPDSKANQRAAQDMLNAGKDNTKLTEQLPYQLANAKTLEEMSRAMADNSILQIPYDQVNPVRDDLYNRVLNSPTDYGINNDTANADLETRAKNLVNDHVQPITDGQYNSHDIGKIAENIYETSHGKVATNMQGNDSEDQLADEKLAEEATIATGEVIGDAAGGPAGAEAGKVAGEVANEAKTEMDEQAGQSTEEPIKASKEIAKESPANDATEGDEQYYGYGH